MESRKFVWKFFLSSVRWTAGYSKPIFEMENVISHILSNISEISPSCSKKEVIFFDRN